MRIKDLLKDRSYVNLDIGGKSPEKNFILLNDTDGDIVWDYTKYPYPLPDSSVDFIKSNNLVEKITRESKGFIKFMDEMWRMLKPDCQFLLTTMYAGSYPFYQDPTNVNPLNEATFSYFDPMSEGDNYKIYRPKPWKTVTVTFQLNGVMEVLLEKRRIDKSYEE